MNQHTIAKIEKAGTAAGLQVSRWEFHGPGAVRQSPELTGALNPGRETRNFLTRVSTDEGVDL